jgi:Ca2+-binding RTX toxin-like protein
MFGGAGNDTMTANGGTGIGLYGLQGNNVYRIIGPITVSLNDLGTFGQGQAQTDGPTPGVNTIVFPGLTRGITLDLSNTSPGPIPVLPSDPGQPQVVATDNLNHPFITLSLIGQFQNVVGTPGNDWIHGDASSNVLAGGGTGNDTLIGGSGPATMVAGSGTDSLVAGSGGTTFRFAGAPGNFGNVIIDPPAGNVMNALDFSAFGGPVTINLGSTSPQTVSGASGLTLTLQNPAEINALMDSNFNDHVIGNASGDTFFVGGSGNDTFTGGGGADFFVFSGSRIGSDVLN